MRRPVRSRTRASTPPRRARRSSRSTRRTARRPCIWPCSRSPTRPRRATRPRRIAPRRREACLAYGLRPVISRRGRAMTSWSSCTLRPRCRASLGGHHLREPRTAVRYAGSTLGLRNARGTARGTCSVTSDATGRSTTSTNRADNSSAPCARRAFFPRCPVCRGGRRRGLRTNQVYFTAHICATIGPLRSTLPSRVRKFGGVHNTTTCASGHHLGRRTT